MGSGVLGLGGLLVGGMSSVVVAFPHRVLSSLFISSPSGFILYGWPFVVRENMVCVDIPCG
jgi:hypothetical protein